MNQCSKCSSVLHGKVSFCPFCGEGTGAGGGRARPPAAAAAIPPEPAVVPAAAPAPAPTPVPAAPVAAPAPASASAQAAPAGTQDQAKAVKATEAASPVRQATTGTPATRGAAAEPAATPVVPVKKGGKGKWILAGIVLALVVLYNIGKNEEQVGAQVDCDTAFDLGSKAVAAGELPEARTHALRAVAACVDGQRGKADALQGAIAAAEKTNDACLRSFRTIEGQVQDGRLGRARTGLDGLTATCAAKPAAADLRKQLSVAQAAGRTAQAEVRTALDARDAAQAKAALAKLTGVNREDADLARLKGEVEALSAAIAAEQAASAAAAAATAAASAPPVETRQTVAPRTPDRPVSPASSRNADAADSRTSMVSIFLRDAEQALTQRKFDAARTYVDSARRIDPNDPRLDSLMQQIRDRERQMLQQETTIR